MPKVFQEELFPKRTGRSGRRDFNEVVWQDDGVTIHRTDVALQSVKESFRQRINPKVQAPKMDALWPLEVPWAIIDEQLRKKRGKIKTKKGLKKFITKAWRSVSAETCKKLLEAVPGRLQAIIDKEGGRLLGRRTENV